MAKILHIIKKDVVLVLAISLAILSSFFIPPDKKYLGYIDIHTLLLLFNLMAIMAGFQSLHIFEKIAALLLKLVHTSRGITLILVILPFVFSMLITNDVALITFVPLTIAVLEMSDMTKLLVPIVVFQTIAANLGSMMTPMGNPQNLYLYRQSGFTMGQFILTMLPYTAAALVLLLLCSIFMKSHSCESILSLDNTKLNIRKFVIYLLMFLVCIACVIGIIPLWITTVLVVLCFLIVDYKIFFKVDYALLGSFLGFFIFIGNISRIDAFHQALSRLVEKNVILISIASSQVISNVPATLLLSEFTDHWCELMIGINLGGLGTLIASMASLISYKQVAKAYPEKRGSYFLRFTTVGILFLIAQLLLYWVLHQ